MEFRQLLSKRPSFDFQYALSTMELVGIPIPSFVRTGNLVHGRHAQELESAKKPWGSWLVFFSFFFFSIQAHSIICEIGCLATCHNDLSSLSVSNRVQYRNRYSKCYSHSAVLFHQGFRSLNLGPLYKVLHNTQNFRTHFSFGPLQCGGLRKVIHMFFRVREVNLVITVHQVTVCFAGSQLK